jgi:two-component system phosphate regulon sensor histidine kinase PhoR
MAKKIFTFIFPSTLIVILMSVGVITWLFSDFFRDYYINMTRDRLQSNALAMRSAVECELDRVSRQGLQKLVKELADNTQTRVTVIDIEGKVLADSNEDPEQMENHSTPDRKEILNAIKGDIGYSVRYSSTLKKDTMYVAVPIVKNGKVTAVLRTSFFLDTLHRFLNNTYSHIVGLALLVATIAICISYVISKQISTPLEKLKFTASGYAKGDFTVRTPDTSISEIRELSESMNIMSQELQNNINEITQQKNDLKLILSSMLEGVIAIDLDDKIISINSAARKILNTNIPVSSPETGENSIESTLFKYPNKDNSKEEDTALFRETVRNTEIHKLINEIQEKGQPISRKIELIGLRSKIIDVHGAVLRNALGECIGVLLVVNDITQLSQLENMRKNFAANVSHELKTPLTAIKGAVETLIDGAVKDNKEAEKFLRIIDRHSERLNALINDIMSLSKVEKENEEESINFTPCQLKQILDIAQELCQNRAESRDVSIKIDCKEELYVAGNPQMLEQVFVNLIDNAVKFSPEEDEVQVTATMNDETVSITVTDHGCGIPEEHISRLFERFYRVDKGRSRRQGGTGLGLAIVKHIVNAHNGTVEVISNPGEKTVFTVKLPYTMPAI